MIGLIQHLNAPLYKNKAISIISKVIDVYIVGI